jgi:hypothetical protein
MRSKYSATRLGQPERRPEILAADDVPISAIVGIQGET